MYKRQNTHRERERERDAHTQALKHTHQAHTHTHTHSLTPRSIGTLFSNIAYLGNEPMMITTFGAGVALRMLWHDVSVLCTCRPHPCIRGEDIGGSREGFSGEGRQ